MSKPPLIPPHEWLNVGRGLLMGGADIIPGVSGGTVALILGIYERLVTAISRFDTTFLGLLKRRQWLAAAGHIDGAFLLTLGMGIAVGVGGLASLMHWLLEHQLQLTYAVFFGLIVASSWLVARLVEMWTPACFALLAGGAAAALYIVTRDALHNPPEGAGYAFVCGAVAICAMILPGISGAFILLIMGAYHRITGLLSAMLKFQITGDGLLVLGAFAAGAGVGLLSFSKFLKWLLVRFEPQTMSLLCGFMIGSLWKIWPFKRLIAPTGVDTSEIPFKEKRLDNVWPDLSDQRVWLTLLLALLAFAFVFALDYVSRRAMSRDDVEPRDNRDEGRRQVDS